MSPAGMPSLDLVQDDVVSLTRENTRSNEKRLNEKSFDLEKESIADTDSIDGGDGKDLSDAQNLVTYVISVEDDPSLNPWTFRTLVIGIGLSTFGGVLGMSQRSNPRSILTCSSK